MVLCVFLCLIITIVQGKQNKRIIAGVTDAYYGKNRSLDVFYAQLHAYIQSSFQQSVSYREKWLTTDHNNAATAGTISVDNDHRQQQQQQSLLFVKTHKTGGSTLSRLLFRVLCESTSTVDWHCFLPPYDSPGKIWDLRKTADERYVKVTGNKKGRPYDVWVHHTSTPGIIYNEVMALGTFLENKTRLPVETVVNTTTFLSDRDRVTAVGSVTVMPMLLSICRRPALRFRSAWEWYGHQTTLGGLALTDFIALFICNDCRGTSSSTVYPDQLQSQLNPLVSNHSHILTDRALQYVQRFRYRTGLDATSTELIGLDALDHLHTGRQGMQRSRMMPDTPHLWIPSLTSPSSNNNVRRQSSAAILQLFMDKVILPMLKCQSLVLVSDRFDESLLVLRMMTKTTIHHLHLLDLAYVRQKVTPTKQLVSLNDAQLSSLDAIQPFDNALYRTATWMLEWYQQHYPGGQARWGKDLAILRLANTFVADHCEEATRFHSSSSSSGSSRNGTTPLLSEMVDVLHSSPNLALAFKQGNTVNSDAFRAFCDSVKRDNREAVQRFSVQ